MESDSFFTSILTSVADIHFLFLKTFPLISGNINAELLSTLIWTDVWKPSILKTFIISLSSTPLLTNMPFISSTGIFFIFPLSLSSVSSLINSRKSQALSSSSSDPSSSRFSGKVIVTPSICWIPLFRLCYMYKHKIEIKKHTYKKRLLLLFLQRKISFQEHWLISVQMDVYIIQYRFDVQVLIYHSSPLSINLHMTEDMPSISSRRSFKSLVPLQFRKIYEDVCGK